MKVGDLVQVDTKYYSQLTGLIIEHGPNGYLVHAQHTRLISADARDLKVISESR